MDTLEPKTASDLKALSARLAEEKPHMRLSYREDKVFQALASGTSIHEIAEELAIGQSTISTYRRRILRKLGLENNAQLTVYALARGIVNVDDIIPSIN